MRIGISQINSDFSFVYTRAYCMRLYNAITSAYGIIPIHGIISVHAIIPGEIRFLMQKMFV